MKKKTLYLLLLLSLCNFLHSQDTTGLHECQQAYIAAKDDTSRINALRKISVLYNTMNADTAIYFAKKALALAEKINWTKGIAQNCLNLGVFLMATSNYDSALYYDTKALEAAKVVGDSNRIALIFINRGTAYTETQQYEKAMADLIEAMHISEETKNKDRQARTAQSICEVYMYQRNYDAAKPWAEKALQLETELQDEEQQAAAEMTLGGIYSTKKDFQKAEHYLLDAIKKAGKTNRSEILVACYLSLSDTYIETHRYQQAIAILQKGLSYAEASHHAEQIASLYINLGNAYFGSKKFAEALYAHQKGYETIKGQSEFQQDQFMILEGMAKSYSALGNFEKAYETSVLAAAIKDSAVKKEQDQKLLSLQTQFETGQKEKENQLLKSENIATAALLHEKEILLIAAIIGIIMLTGVLYLVYRNRKTKIRNIEKLRALNAQLEEQKEEITRINTLLELKALRAQMNPHFIFNCMSSIQECMLTNRLDDANTYLSKLSRLLRMVLIHSDDESITLDKELEMLQLYLQLESVRLKGSFEYYINVQEDVMTEDILVPTLILQPFAENAIWHGLLNKPAERRLQISVSLENNMIHCTIEDNGIGREKAASLKKLHKKYSSRGIQLVEKRLKILKQQTEQPDTEFKIYDLHNDVQEPAGTRVEITLPVVIS